MSTVSIIATGDELLRGRTAETNSAFLAAALTAHGFEMRRVLIVGDEPADIKAELLRCASDSDVVLVMGGLGPTADDRTRHAVAEAAGLPLVEDPDSRRSVEERITSYGHRVLPGHLVQALFPEGAVIFPNDHGTARGFACRVERALVVAMPGVPGELMPMFADHVLPFLLREFAPSRHVRLAQVRIFPSSESDVDSRVSDMMLPGRNPSLGITVAGGVITLSLRAVAADERQAAHLLERDVSELKRRFGNLVFATDGGSLAEAVAAELEKKALTIAVAESVTGGRVVDLLVGVPGISRFLLAGVVAYSNESKTALLGVPEEIIRSHGAVSAQVAEAMAAGACACSGARLGVSTTGIAGPTGATERKPVGLVYCGVCLDGAARSVRLMLRGDRERIRDRAAKHALNIARLVARGGLDALAGEPYNVGSQD